MKKLVRLSLVAVLAMGVVAAGQPPEKIKVLIVDGQNNHDWAATTKAVKATLLRSGRFTVDVSTSPGRKASEEEWAQWRPAFSDYPVVLSNYNGQPWPKAVEKSFEAYIRGGGSAVMVHAANNAFSGWGEFNKMIGLGWRETDFGARITVDGSTGKQIRTPKGEGQKSGHGRQHAYVVKVRKPDHPIMKGIPGEWMHAKDELYHGQRGPAQNMEILSSAFSAKDTGGTGAHEPITWVIPYGEGKVVTTVLGHHWRNQKDWDALHCVGFQTIVRRTCEWAATGKVTIPVPDNFPTKGKTSIVAP